MIVDLAILAGVISFVVIMAARPLLLRFGVLDVPNERSSHTTKTLRGAGVGPLAGFLAASLLLLTMTSEATARTGVLIMLGVAIPSGLLGLIEDVRGVPIGVRAAAELLIGIAGSIALVIAAGAAPWWIVVGAFVVVAYINVANFMDGVNGISGLHAIVVGGSYAIIATIFGLEWITGLSLVIAAAFAGFLPHNLVRGKVFLGDTGSYFLGAAIAAIALSASFFGVPVLAVLGPITIYLADTGFTLARRALRGERWYAAHRQHVYQRLTDCGLSHVAVAIYVSIFSCVTSALGLLSIVGTGWAWLSVIGQVIIALLYLTSPAIVRNRRPVSEPKCAGIDLLPVGWMAEPIAARRWAIIGATGFVGRNLVAALRSSGAEVVEVRGPRLDLPMAATATTALTVLHGDQTQRVIEDLVRQLSGSNVVINAAGVAKPDSPESPELLGANALLPAVIGEAAARASADRYIHLSSAAVQGNARTIDETTNVAPFSPYSRSKSFGEQVLAEWRAGRDTPMSAVIVRATSVQGLSRRTTANLRRVAKSPLASVAAPGDQQTPVSSVGGLAAFVEFVGAFEGEVPQIVLQPWEGMTTRAVLETAGGRKPLELPTRLCRAVVAIGYQVGRILGGRLSGAIRRIELMWFGQAQCSAWAESMTIDFPCFVRDVLSGTSVDVEAEVGRA